MLKRYAFLIFRAFIIFAIILLFLQALLTFEWGIDNGISLNEAYRILHGDRLYVDFHSFWMPTTTWLLTLIFKIFGASLLNLFIAATLIFAGVCINVFYLTKRLTKSLDLSLIAVFLYLLSCGFYGYGHNWLGLLFSTTLVNVVLRLKDDTLKENKTWLFLGIATGFVITTILWQGGILWLSLTLLLTQFKWNTKERVQKWVLLTLGASLPLLLLTFFMFVTNQGLAFVNETLIFTFTKYLGSQQAISVSMTLIPTLLIYPFLLWNKRKTATTDPIEVLPLIVSFGYILFGLLAPSTGHILWTYVFLIPLFLQFVQERNKQLLRSLSIWTAIVFFTLIPMIEMYKLGLIQERHYRLGKIANTTLPLSERHQQIINVLKDNEYIKNRTCVIAPWAPEFYFVFNIKNPISYNFMGPEHYNETVQNEIVEELKEKHVDCIIYLDTLNTMYPGSPKQFVDYMLDNYELVTPLYGKPDPRHNGVWILKD